MTVAPCHRIAKSVILIYRVLTFTSWIMILINSLNMEESWVTRCVKIVWLCPKISVDLTVLTILPTSHHDWPAVHRWARVSVKLPFIHYTSIRVIFHRNKINRTRECLEMCTVISVSKSTNHFWFPVWSDNTSFTVVLFEYDSASWIHQNGNYLSWDLFCVSLFCVLLCRLLIISPQSTIHY